MLTIKDIVESLVRKHQLDARSAEVFVNVVIETIHEGLKNDRIVKIKGFGTFKLTAVRERESINVNTGERVVISSHDKVSFTPDAVMRDLVNKPFAQFDTVVLADGVDFEDMPEVETEDGDSVADVEMETPVREEVPSAIEAAVKAASAEIATPVEAVAPSVEESAPVKDEAMAVLNEEIASAAVEVNVLAALEAETPQQEAIEVVPNTQEEPISEPLDGTHSGITAEEEPKTVVVEMPVPEPVVEELVVEVPVKEQEPEVEQETEAEPETTPEVVAEPAPEEDAVEEELVAAVETPAASATPVNTVVSETPAEPKASVEPEAEEPETDETDYLSEFEEDGMSECTKIFLMYAIIVNVIVAALFFVFGYFAHSSNLLGIEPEKEAPAVESVETQAAPAVTTTPEKEATPAASEKAEEAAPAAEKKEEKPVEEKKVTEEPKKKEEKAEPKAEATSKYDSDPRVRTGAYRIVGVANTVTVKSGQTIKGISKTYLGPGMECYVEVFNGGITELKEGQTIKIPKLELKKKAKK